MYPEITQKKYIKNNWKRLSGSGECPWVGLINPLDEKLRSYLIHYGELSQSTYDAFDRTTSNCLFAENEFFNRVGLRKSHAPLYTVTRFIYTTSSLFDNCCMIATSNWSGYVAVTTDLGREIMGRRDIAICWRGTIQKMEWAENFNRFLTSAHEICHPNQNSRCNDDADPPMVHSGWLSIYNSSCPNSHSNISARQQVRNEVRRLIEHYKSERVSITVTGHSLGASLAIINASDIVTNGLNVPHGTRNGCPVAVFAFASPRFGNESFCRLMARNQYLRILRIENKYDIIPKVSMIGYDDIDEVLDIKVESGYLKEPFDLFVAHTLEVYLHGIAGARGNENVFRENRRDLKLLNKHKDLLKDEVRERYNIPIAWWPHRKYDGTCP